MGKRLAHHQTIGVISSGHSGFPSLEVIASGPGSLSLANDVTAALDPEETAGILMLSKGAGRFVALPLIGSRPPKKKKEGERTSRVNRSSRLPAHPRHRHVARA
jgi:hypothetical protein